MWYGALSTSIRIFCHKRGRNWSRLPEFKNLGTIVDNMLTFKPLSVECFTKKIKHLLRKLRSFNASKHSLRLVRRSLVDSVSFHVVSMYGNLQARDRNKLSQVVKQAGGKIIGHKQTRLAHVKADSRTKGNPDLQWLSSQKFIVLSALTTRKDR